MKKLHKANYVIKLSGLITLISIILSIKYEKFLTLFFCALGFYIFFNGLENFLHPERQDNPDYPREKWAKKIGFVLMFLGSVFVLSSLISFLL